MFDSSYLFLPSLVGLVVFYVTRAKKEEVDSSYFYACQFVVGNSLTLLILWGVIRLNQLTSLSKILAYFNHYYLPIALCVSGGLILFFYLKGISIVKGQERKPMTGRRFFFLLTSFLFLFIGFFSLLGSVWLIDTFGVVSPEQLLYHIFAPLEGTNNDFVVSLITKVVVGAVFIPLVLLFFLDNPLNAEVVKSDKDAIKWELSVSPIMKKMRAVVVAILSICLLGIGAVVIDAEAFYHYLTSSSFFIADHYVVPKKELLQFPEKKRNLIFIYVESLESTFFSQELGGQMPDNVLEPLTDLAREGVQFSDTTDEFGGAVPISGTTWTIAGMVAQTAGLPLKVDVDGNAYADSESSPFLPGAVTLGDLLEEAGYNQMIMVGSELVFGGRKNYLTQHGNYEVFDYETAKEQELIPSDYKEWWGFEDSRLFEYAKSEITKKAAGAAPFNFTMLTANTHHVDGYLEPEAPTTFSEQYSNVYAYTAEQLAEFIEWLEKQEFYENTSVIISGDHLSMDAKYFERQEIATKDRRVFSLFLNSQLIPNSTTERAYSTMDIFPTTLATLGVTIKGERLGLGTNLFSATPTLLEELGTKEVNDQMAQTSDFYKINLLKDSEL